MNNEYLKYSDYAIGAKENAEYSINVELQEGSNPSQLRFGVKPIVYASLEQGEYITSNPKLLYKDLSDLGVLTKNVSDINGIFEPLIVLTATLSGYYSMIGITLHSRNNIEDIEIIAYRDEEEIARKSFTNCDKKQFFDIPLDKVNEIVFIIPKIKEPYHFFGIYDIEYGKDVIFDKKTNIDVEISNFFSAKSDTLQYDTLTIQSLSDKSDSLFQNKQKIEYIKNDETLTTFYLDNVNKNNDYTATINAYDFVANLEGDYYGGMYKDEEVKYIIYDILNVLDIEIEFENVDGILVNGYLPIMSRRKALQQVLQGSNIRCYKGQKLLFKPLESTIQDTILDETNILTNPQKSKKNLIRSVTVKQHNYSEGKDEIEVYNWYIAKNKNVVITFPEPVHSLKAYEVTGTNQETGEEILEEISSPSIFWFVGKFPNYCEVINRSSNKIVLIGKTYVTSTESYTAENELIQENLDYKEIVIDSTITANPQDVANLLYSIYNRKYSIRFKTLEDVKLGYCYNILGENLNIISKTHNLDGLYEVEAE